MPRRLVFRLLFYVVTLASMTFALQTLADPTVAAFPACCDADSDCPKGYVCETADCSGDSGKICFFVGDADASSPRNLAAPFMAK